MKKGTTNENAQPTDQGEINGEYEYLKSRIDSLVTRLQHQDAAIDQLYDRVHLLEDDRDVLLSRQLERLNSKLRSS